MSPWRELKHGLRGIFAQSEVDRDADDEVRFYYEQTVAANIAAGMSRTDAERSARLEMGGALQAREEVRTSGWESIVLATLADIRFAWRRLIGAPAFAMIALLTLGLGIGGTTAIFSAVNSILFSGLPYTDANRIVAIQEVYPDGGKSDGSWGMYHFMSQRTRSLDAIAVVRAWEPVITGGDHPERLDGQRVSAAFFDVLRTRTAIGAGFDPADDRAGGRNVTILSDALWRRRFGADPRIVGQEVRLNDNKYTVVGVLPAGFRNVLMPSAGIYSLLQYDLSEGRAWGHHLQTIGRLRAGVTHAAAQRELNALGPQIIEEQHPDSYSKEVRWTTPTLQTQLTASARRALLTVLAAVGLVLVIACVNVTNLLLARGVQRRGEFALRAALGAGRARLIRQLLTESLLLSALGGAVAIAVATAGIRTLAALAPASLPRADNMHINVAGFAFAFVVTMLVGVACGMIPALQASRNEHDDLQSSRRTAGHAHSRIRRALVIAEVSLALTLMVTSGLLLRSLRRLLDQPIGFTAEHALTMQVQTTGAHFADDRAVMQFFDNMLAAVRNVPGVKDAALTSQLPLSDDFDAYGVHFMRPGQKNDDRSAFRYAVSPGYIAMMGIPLKSGRAFTTADAADAPPVAIISTSLASQVFGARNPIGEKLAIGGFDDPIYTIVGVVGDVRQQSLALEAPGGVYIPESQSEFGDRTMTLVVRTSSDHTTLAADLRRAIWSVNPDQAVVRVATLQDIVESTAADRRFALTLFEAFAITALILAAAGLYGVLAGSVAERTREIGVRTALGATRSDVLAMVFREGLQLTSIGIALGVIGAIAASQVTRAMLFGTSPLDAATYVSVVALLVAVAVLACAIPAFRAARVNPSVTLRAD
jgi:putative ABC transport system permease protein